MTQICPICGKSIWKQNGECEDEKCRIRLLDYFTKETKQVSLIMTDGKRDDLTGDEIHNLLIEKLKNHSRKG